MRDPAFYAGTHPIPLPEYILTILPSQA